MKIMPLPRMKPGLFCLFVSALFALQPFVFADGNINITNKYAWAENGGWLNFRPSHATNVEVMVFSRGSNSFVSGYAWGENVGWVKLAASTNGPFNNDATNDWGVNMDTNWDLSGYAWSENAGWIKFHSPATTNQVTIDAATGLFDGYAWGENGGWIHFHCTNDASSNAYQVQTDSLSAPADISATDGSYTNKVLVTWGSVIRATCYEVWRSTNSNSGTASRLSIPSTTNYNDSSVIPGVTYYYWMKSASASWTGEFSSCDSGWRGLPMPASVSATDGTYADKVRITWTASEGAASYEVWRSIINDSVSASRVGEPSSTSYDDTVTQGTTYYYWLKTKGTNSQVSVFSSPDSGYCGLFAPTWLTASYGTYPDKVWISWASVAAATSYQVWRNTSNDTASASMLTETTSRTFSDDSAVPGTIYYYWVKAKAAISTSEFSGSASGYCSLSAPTGISASDGTYSDKVLVTWNTCSGIASYEVWRGSRNNTVSASKVYETTSTSWNDTTVEVNTIYYYWVKSKGATETSGFSSSDSGYRTSLQAPSGLSASDGIYPDKVKITWSASTLAASASQKSLGSASVSYEVWRNTSDSSSSAGKLADTASTSYDDTSAQTGVIYYYWVKAKRAAETSDFSSSNTGYLLTAPTGVSASDGTYRDKVLVTWSTAGASTSYEVWRNTTNSTGSAVKLSDTSGASYCDTSAGLDITYYYWVKAKSTGETSGFSSSDSGWRRSRVIFGDYDGDLKTDMVLYCEESGIWSVMLSGSDVLSQAKLGGPGYTPVSGDYDGDGIYDLAVDQVSTRYWFIQLSSSSGLFYEQFGGVGYTPVSGDFDGDGKTDLAVYQESTGYWFIVLSSTYSLSYTKLGEPGYTPVPGDFDGDGTTDMAVYHEASGYWYMILSSSWSLSYAKFGEPEYTPVSGDFDGDSKADLAVYHEASGYWYILLSSSLSLSYAKFGEAGYSPVPGDFDGDGKTDLAVYHEASGYWFIVFSSNMELSYVKFGETGYVPVW